jgi:DNA modification methylase
MEPYRHKRKLTEIFTVPPISTLDIKQKYWKDRKAYWNSLGIKSELGRNDNLLKLSKIMQEHQNSTSIFDPVLCELMYSWFTAPDDIVLDPFAGGSVRGIIASKLQRNYSGIELREEQVEHNRIQAAMCESHVPTWINGSSTDITIDEKCDFLFTCPPYYDLEVYSDMEDDLSAMSHDDFEDAFRKSIALNVAQLKDDRFCAIVVGDVRGQDGNYLKFPQKTVEIFEDNGCKLYNELILLQEPAFAAFRAFNLMNSSRKIAKSHQNVFVFIKGDYKAATNRLPQFETDAPNTTIDTFFE